MSAKDHRSQIVMNYRAVATALIVANNLHAGFWRVALMFGQVAAVNVDMAGKLVPAAFLPVMGIRLMQDEEPNDLTVDAAEVNPASRIIKPDFAGLKVN